MAPLGRSSFFKDLSIVIGAAFTGAWAGGIAGGKAAYKSSFSNGILGPNKIALSPTGWAFCAIGAAAIWALLMTDLGDKILEKGVK